MALSRKHQRELKRLKTQAEATLHDQRQVLEHAANVVRDATRQAANYGREEFTPRAKDAYRRRIRPAVAAGISSTRAASHQTRERFVEDVLPAMSSALGTALAALEVARSPAVRDAIGTMAGTMAGRVRGRSSSSTLITRGNTGPAKYILLGLGIVAVAGVAYAAWQTVRTGDDLWIDDDANDDILSAESD